MRRTASKQVRPNRRAELPGDSTPSEAPRDSLSAPESETNPSLPQGPAITTFSVLFARITWFFAGPVVLFLILMKIIGSGSGWLTVLDGVFWGLVGLMVWCRWIEQRSGAATTSLGQPATWKDFRRYALALPLVAMAAWIAANALGNHLLGGIPGF